MYPNPCTNKAFSSTSTKFNPYFGWWYCFIYFIPAKVGIKSCRCAREGFIFNRSTIMIQLFFTIITIHILLIHPYISLETITLKPACPVIISTIFWLDLQKNSGMYIVHVIPQYNFTVSLRCRIKQLEYGSAHFYTCGTITLRLWVLYYRVRE